MPAPKPRTSKPKAGQNKQSADQRIRLFVEAYLSNNQNASKAALAAGFSAKSAASQGSRLLKNVKVQQLLDSRRSESLEAAQLTTAAVLDSLRQALFFDPRKLYRDDGTIKTVPELDDDTAMALAAFEVMEEYGPEEETKQEPQAHGGSLKRSRRRRVEIGHTVKVKWLDKNVARDQAAKLLRMHKEPERPPTAGEIAGAVVAGFTELRAAFDKRLGRTA